MNTPVRSHAVTSSGLPPLARFRFQLQALDAIRLPDYAGSAWRGLLGHGLRRTACVTRQPNCTGCLLIHGCVYSQVFETPPPPGLSAGGFSAVPHPYVLAVDPSAPKHYARGERLSLGMTLMGAAITQVPYLIRALEVAGELGVGTDPGRFRLVHLEREATLGSERWDIVFRPEVGDYRQVALESPVLPPAPDSLRLRLITPLRLKRDGHFVTPRTFTPLDLIHHLDVRLRRLALLYGGDPSAFDRRRDADHARTMEVAQRDLAWHDWTRYSSRQQARMQMGGIIGQLVLRGPGVAPLWPALWAGQWTHVGKGTAFGLGRYRIHPEGGSEG